MILRLLSAMRRRRAKAARAVAAARLAHAMARRDSRSVHTASEQMKAATTNLLRSEMWRG